MVPVVVRGDHLIGLVCDAVFHNPTQIPYAGAYIQQQGAFFAHNHKAADAVKLIHLKDARTEFVIRQISANHFDTLLYRLGSSLFLVFVDDLIAVNGNGSQQDQTLDNALPVGVDAHQNQTIVQNTKDDNADDRTADLAFAAGDGNTAKHWYDPP